MATNTLALVQSYMDTISHLDAYYNDKKDMAATEEEYKKIQKEHIKLRTDYNKKIAVLNGELPDPKTYKKSTKKNASMREVWNNAYR